MAPPEEGKQQGCSSESSREEKNLHVAVRAGRGKPAETEQRGRIVAEKFEQDRAGAE